MSRANVGRRERHVNERRDRIFRAAIDLFVEQGYDRTSMDEVASRADVSRATVFNLFERKTALLEAWAAERRRIAFEAAAERGLEGPVLDVISRYMVELARVSTSARNETREMLGAVVRLTNVFADPPLAEQMAQLVEHANARGELTTRPDPHLAGMIIATSFFAVMSTWIAPDEPPFELEEMLLRMVTMLLKEW